MHICYFATKNMAKGRILYINQGVVPFSEETESTLMNRYLPQFTQELGREIRVFVPRFTDINERKHQLHEVIRLSGMNLIVNNCDHQLIIKVGSIPTARLQVYFIDNDEYFTKFGDTFDSKGKLIPSNDERILFFGRGSLEAVRKLAWQPHLIHFSGWFSGMVPFYLRRINKENAFFSGTRTVLSLEADKFEGKFAEAEPTLSNISQEIISNVPNNLKNMLLGFFGRFLDGFYSFFDKIYQAIKKFL